MKTQTHHTPKGWEVIEIKPSSIGSASFEIVDGIDKPISFISEPQPRSRDEMRANARLMSASPELLDACKEALALIQLYWPLEHGNPVIGKAWRMLESAISKAERGAE